VLVRRGSAASVPESTAAGQSPKGVLTTGLATVPLTSNAEPPPEFRFSPQLSDKRPNRRRRLSHSGKRTRSTAKNGAKATPSSG
jgi:hypothetical protein